VGRANADDGRSGYGSESVRPYLRAQLRHKELMQAPQLNNVVLVERRKRKR
jgi:hypothetical protein